MMSPEQTLNRLKQHTGKLVLDVETSGLDPRRNHIVAYVITFSDDPRDTTYIPVRHAGGGNIDGGTLRPPLEAISNTKVLPFEHELAKIFRDSSLEIIGHNLMFDLLFMAKHSITFPNCKLSCTQVRQALIDEFTPSFSLDSSARHMRVTEKKGDELYKHIGRLYDCPPDRKSMAHYWRLAGNDPIAVDYAIGDGISTWELYHAQEYSISEQDLHKVWGLEQRTTRTLFRMQNRGIRIDVEYMEELRKKFLDECEELRKPLHKFGGDEGFKERSASHVEAAYRDAGYHDKDFKRSPTGRFSFTEEWMETNELGRQILQIRKNANMVASFVGPLLDTHLYQGRVYPSYNQLKGDEFGTVSGRLSSNNPNIQQVPKHDERLSKLIRRGFIPDDGHFWSSKDAKQCLAADTEVMIPGETKKIKDIVAGDYVYSYNDDKTPTLKKVLWSGQTGVRKLYRLHWMTNGRTGGYLDATDDHLIRIDTGEYKSVKELIDIPKSRKGQHRYNISVWAMRRTVQTSRKEKRNYIFTDGHTRYKESRLVLSSINGEKHEEVHHIDENTLNDNISNLQGMTKHKHLAEHGKIREDVKSSKVIELYNKGLTQREIAKMMDCSQKLILDRIHQGNPGNHTIINIEELPGVHLVYDITVEDTHNFIANEICVHNCEPRIFAQYTGSKFLINGYTQSPAIDLYTNLDKVVGIGRQKCKKLALALFYIAGKDKAAQLIGCTPDEAAEYRNRVRAEIPEIDEFNKSAENNVRRRAKDHNNRYGYVKTISGRRLKFDDLRFAYKAGNRIVQGSNADFIKHACNDVSDYLESEKVGNLLLTCHDNLENQIIIGRDDIDNEVTKIMENAAKCETINFTVPQEAECGRGANWAEATFGIEI